jgi:iron complex outermembrane receptor protein
VKYINNGVHKGSVAFGAEYTRFKFDDMRYTIGYNYTQSDTLRLPKNIVKGNENSFSSFVQLKHQWKSLILNAGLRYDYKDRYDNSRIHEYSPRLSLIYLRPQWNAKISYSKSFIDAPYLYRKMNDALYQLRYSTEVSDDKMTPEYLHSMQFTLGGTEWVRGLNLELNAFYNHAKDLIYVKTIDYENLGE